MFGKKSEVTIDGIVADIQNKVEALTEIGRAKEEEVSAIGNQITQLKVLQSTAGSEMTRANNLANNFSNLLEG